MGDYRATYRAQPRTTRSGSGPSGGRQRRRGGPSRPRCSTTADAPFYRWFPDGELNTCENALDRHVAAGHGDRTALIYDSPVTGTQRTYTYAELLDEVATFAGALRVARRRQGRPGHRLHADGARGRGRDAGLRAARRGALGRVRRLRGRRARRPDRRRRSRRSWCPRRAASRSRGSSSTSRCSTGRSSSSSHQPEHVRRAAAPAGGGGDDRPAATSTGHELMRRGRAGRAACRSQPPTRSTSSTRPARPRSPRASCATTAATRSRWRGRMANIYDIGPGDVWWTASDVGWVVGHSYIVYAPLLVGATTVLYEGKPVGTPDAGAFWRVVAEHKVAGAVHRADRDPRDQEGGPRGRAARAVRRRRRLRTLFLAGERLDPDTWEWATERLGRAGHRPLVADRDRLADRGQPARASSRCRSSRARRPCRCRATTCGCSTRPATRCRAGSRGRDLHQAAAAAGHAADAVGRRRAVRRVVPLGVRRLLPHRRRRLRRRGRLPVRDGPHRRRHQRRRPPALDRVDGGGAGRPPGGRRVRGDRRARRPQGPGAARARGAQGRGRRRPGRSCAPSWCSGCATRSARWRRCAQVDVVAALPKTRSGKILRRTMRAIADGARNRCRPPSRTSPCSMRCARPWRTGASPARTKAPRAKPTPASHNHVGSAVQHRQPPPVR